MKAAKRLFSEQGILAVSVRDIAREAGVTHGLVHHYFGTKEALAEEVIRSTMTSGLDLIATNQLDPSSDSLGTVKRLLRRVLTEHRSSILLIARAELNGFEPEKMEQPGTPHTIELIARRFAELQDRMAVEEPRLDPVLVSLWLGAAVYGLTMMHPWLMSSAGLPTEDYEQRLDEIVDVGAAFVASAVGLRT